jgi:hypothetical protein
VWTLLFFHSPLFNATLFQLPPPRSLRSWTTLPPSGSI